jgi:hypothetical protein
MCYSLIAVNYHSTSFNVYVKHEENKGKYMANTIFEQLGNVMKDFLEKKFSMSQMKVENFKFDPVECFPGRGPGFSAELIIIGEEPISLFYEQEGIEKYAGGPTNEDAIIRAFLRDVNTDLFFITAFKLKNPNNYIIPDLWNNSFTVYINTEGGQSQEQAISFNQEESGIGLSDIWDADMRTLNNSNVVSVLNQAAKQVRPVLRGAAPSDIVPVIPDPGEVTFNPATISQALAKAAEAEHQTSKPSPSTQSKITTAYNIMKTQQPVSSSKATKEPEKPEGPTRKGPSI